MSGYEINSVLPGKLLLDRGTARDFAALERFHYRARRPATWCQVWSVRYYPCGDWPGPQTSILAAAAVLSYPTLACHARDQALGIAHLSLKARRRFVNHHVRTISRVAVHPTFRSLGLARALVRCILYHCPTRYVEALAHMARAHPFFEMAGMTSCPPQAPGPIYYWHDRHNDARSFMMQTPEVGSA